MNRLLAAFVDEDNCIGCGKCIRVCPTDAIVGAKNFLHTIIPQLCTSCEECINACPTDCIVLKTLCEPMTQEREAELKLNKKTRLALTKSAHLAIKPTPALASHQDAVFQRKQQIADAIARAKAKRDRVNKPT